MKHIVATLALCAALGACADEVVQRPPSLAVQRAEARASASTIAQAFRSGEIVGACASPAPSGPPSTVVLLNARQCLSCRDLGYMLRRLPGNFRTEPPRCSLRQLPIRPLFVRSSGKNGFEFPWSH